MARPTTPTPAIGSATNAPRPRSRLDWVFAGSELIEDPATKKPIYAADDGDLITVANFSSAILDLPFASTANDTDRLYVANTDRIPPRGTPVFLVLKPRRTDAQAVAAQPCPVGRSLHASGPRSLRRANVDFVA